MCVHVYMYMYICGLLQLYLLSPQSGSHSGLATLKLARQKLGANLLKPTYMYIYICVYIYIYVYIAKMTKMNAKMAKMRAKMAKMRPKMAKMRLKMGKMSLKIAKMRPKMAKLEPTWGNMEPIFFNLNQHLPSKAIFEDPPMQNGHFGGCGSLAAAGGKRNARTPSHLQFIRQLGHLGN